MTFFFKDPLYCTLYFGVGHQSHAMPRLSYPSGPVEGEDGYGPTGSNAGGYGGWLWRVIGGFLRIYGLFDISIHIQLISWMFLFIKEWMSTVNIFGDLKNSLVRYWVFGILMSCDDSFQISHQISWDG